MKKQLKYSINVLVKSNIWIAIATVSFYELSLLQNGKDFIIDGNVPFLFFSTIFIYNIFQILNHFNKKSTWTTKMDTSAKLIISISFIGTLISFYFFDKQNFGLVLLSAALSFIYLNPFSKSKTFNLRNFWFLKSIIVAVVWILLTVLLPLSSLEIAVDLRMVLFEKFLFILGITIPYDIKDINIDKLDGVTTFANKFGIKVTKIVSVFILIIGFILATFLFPKFILPITFTYAVTIILVSQLNENRCKLWYTFLIDGTIILYFFSLWTFLIID